MNASGNFRGDREKGSAPLLADKKLETVKEVIDSLPGNCI